jgi:hypothetical protein
MNGSRESFTRNCAQALLNYSNCPYEPTTVIRLDCLTYVLHTHKSKLIEGTAQAYHTLLTAANLDVCRLGLLIDFLDTKGFLKLFPTCVRCFYELYKERHNVATCTIKSSHRLSPEHKQALYEFVHQAARKKIIYTCARDKKLIAGIRIDSETFVWEQSIARQLRAIAQLQ